MRSLTSPAEYSVFDQYSTDTYERDRKQLLLIAPTRIRFQAKTTVFSVGGGGGMFRHVVWYKFIGVSEERATVFPRLACSFFFLASLAYCSLKAESIRSEETSANFYQSSQRNSPKDNLHDREMSRRMWLHFPKHACITSDLPICQNYELIPI
jgi:hypothetical protein